MRRIELGSKIIGLGTAGIFFLEGCVTPGASQTKPAVEPTGSTSTIVTYGEMPSQKATPSLIIPSGGPYGTPPPSPKLETSSPEPILPPQPKTLDSIINGDHPTIILDTVNSDIQKANKNPNGKNAFPNSLSILNNCESTESKVSKSACAYLIDHLFMAFEQTGDINFFNAAVDAYNFAIGLGLDYKTFIDENLSSNM